MGAWWKEELGATLTDPSLLHLRCTYRVLNSEDATGDPLEFAEKNYMLLPGLTVLMLGFR